MEHPEDVFCSTTELKANLKKYKQLAKSCIVHVTEHGHEGYIFTSVEVFDQRKQEVCHRAKWQVWAENACYKGTHDSSEWFDLSPRVAIEYLSPSWDDHLSASFDNDVRRFQLSDESFAIVKQCLERLSVNAYAGKRIEVGPEARLSKETMAFRLNAGAYDIIYGVKEGEDLRVYGLIEAL